MTENDFQKIAGLVCISMVVAIICLLVYLSILAHEQIELVKLIGAS